MIYKYIAPSPHLKEYVRDYLIAHFVFDKNNPIPIKSFSPKPELAIAFIPKGNLIMSNVLNGETQNAPSASISGQQVSRYNFFLTPEYLMFRINFLPGALYRLLHIPLFEFTNTWFDAEIVINREIFEVNERLTNSTNYINMIKIVECYLEEKIKKVKTAVHSLDKVASLILDNPSRFSLEWLASQACLCERQFNRKFIERIGVGPKLFSRIVRFYRAYRYKEIHPHEDWLSVALFFGYSDYQHMVKDFTEFTHVTPNLWIQQDNQSPERSLGLE